MKFTYTFRAQNGTLGNGEIEALDRADAFINLRKKGIGIIKLDVGRLPRDAQLSHGKIRDLQRYLKWPVLVCSGTIILICIVIYCIKPILDIGETSDRGHELRSSRSRSGSKSSVTSSSQTQTFPRQLPSIRDIPSTDVDSSKNEKQSGVFAPGMIRLPNGIELRFRLPPEGEVRELLAGGELWEIDHNGNVQNKTPPPIFERPFEAGLSSLVEREDSVLPFVLENISEAEALRMCKEPTLSYTDDTPEITKKRENVAMIKTAAIAYVENGGTFSDFVKEIREFSQTEQRLHIEGLRKIHELVKAGRQTEALDYFDQYSNELKDNGFSGMRIPRFIQEKMLKAE